MFSLSDKKIEYWMKRGQQEKSKAMVRTKIA